MAPTLLQQAGAIKVSKLLPLEFCHFFTHVLMRNGLNGCKGDLQVPNAKAIMDHEVMFDAVLEKLWPTVEEISGEIVLPSYAYSRLYTNGDTLEKHTDRPACEVSMTIQLGRSHH